MNVVLVGYRGTGKSAVAKLLADALGLEVVSLDAELIKKAGKSVPEIVEQQGWAGFRDLEEEIVRTFAARDGLVIDCGGGVIERESNFGVLREAGPVFWLKASPRTIVERIGGDDQRPSLTGTKSFTDEVVEVLERRTPLYERIAHKTIDTDSRSIEAVAAEIERQL
ncbi:shikimate kinase [Novipirellula artificiosorum]|uniref:Shikimate kinase n=1 Tax=Novipirellula artificiosorum TaxID=2528016 RepID=A0A5C6DWE8_9BACT|nr:shikimate kinase [Novipirellula artificiosorum]TWU41723.1 Shikimate kinase 2 [Novipirellula artificiosorum]